MQLTSSIEATKDVKLLTEVISTPFGGLEGDGSIPRRRYSEGTAARLAHESLLNTSLRRNAPASAWNREIDNSADIENTTASGDREIRMPSLPDNGGLGATCGCAQEGEEHALDAAYDWAEKGSAVSLAAMLLALLAGGPVGQQENVKKQRSYSKRKGTSIGSRPPHVVLPYSPLVFHLRRTRPLG